jgi:uncharacterized protein YuzE
MNKTSVRYFEQEDILHTVEINDRDELIGVEILNASKFLRDAVLESIQAKTLQLLESQAA